MSVPPVLPQWHVKDSGHSANSAGDRLHLNTHTPLTQRSRSGLTVPLSRHSVRSCQETSSRSLSGNMWPQSSRLAEPLWTDSGLQSGISARDLTSFFFLFFFLRRRRRMNCQTFSQNPRTRAKTHHDLSCLLYRSSIPADHYLLIADH